MRWARLKRPTRAKASATSSHSVPAERLVGRAVFDARELGSWYPPVLLGPGTLGTLATSSDTLRQAIDVLERLESDEYIRYLLAYYREGLQRFGDVWRYADIVTVLIAAAQLLRPASYLEIGVRRGRSMAVVAQACPECEAIGFDLWTGDYAGMANPGPAFVRAEMRKVGHTGRLELISGNSHVTLPAYFEAHPDAFFDWITAWHKP